MKKDCLLILTNNFPYGVGEEFLEQEIEFLSKSFYRIKILSSSRNAITTRRIPFNVEVERIQASINFIDKLSIFKYMFTREFISEIQIIKKEYNHDLSYPLIKNILSYLILGSKLYKKLKIIVNPELNSFNVYLYSYWMEWHAFSIAKFKKRNNGIKVFCRAHGGDLYFERNSLGYLPFRYYILKEMDTVFSISHHGKAYLQGLFTRCDFNIQVSKLGTSKPYPINIHRQSNLGCINLVSCSYIKPVKRIDLIIHSLEKIVAHKILWTHIGDGAQRNIIEPLANQLLKTKTNINYQFLGHLENSDIHKYYSQNYIDLFINLSDSEGIPVSIMEAMSYGIPVIARNVGAVREIVNQTNGLLLTESPSVEEILQGIIYILSNSISNDSFRESAYQTWRKNFNAEFNYIQFINRIKSL